MSAYLQCRLCAEWKIGNELINVNQDEARQLKLELKIQQCLSLNFDSTELPNNVCLLCCDKVGFTYDFQELVKKAQQNILDAIVEKKINIKTELPDQETDSYQYFETLFNDYDNDGVVKKQVKDEDSSQAQPTQTIIENVSHIRGKVLIMDTTQGYRTKTGELTKYGNEMGLVLKRHRERKRKRKGTERSKLVLQNKDEWKLYKWKCILCETVCTSVEDFRNHFTNDHNQDPIYSCTECSKVYELLANFKHHVQSHRDKFRFKCQICFRYFYTRSNYESHLETHSTVKRYTCTKCGKLYKTSESLKGHLRTYHQLVPKPTNFECEICSKKFATKVGLYFHNKSIHLGEKDFTCDQCGKTFLTNSAAKEHINTVHSDAKPFGCDQCQQTFKTQLTLKKHLRIHSDEKRHACEVCAKRFHTKSALSTHSSVHTGVLAFTCEYCPKAFRLKPTLKVHMRQHTGERPYSCLECNHNFSNSGNYIKHMKRKHGKMSKTKHVISGPDVEKKTK